MRNCDHNNYPNKIYRVEHSKMLIEILDDQHIQGSAQYFSSIRSRDNFIDSIKNNILKISIDELKKIQNYWKIKNEVIDYKMDPVKRTQEKKVLWYLVLFYRAFILCIMIIREMVVYLWELII